jgi:hypothetical protein
MGVDGQRHTPAVFPLGKTRYPLYRRLGGHETGLDRHGKSRPLLGFDPRTVQPVVSHYTDYTIPAPYMYVYMTAHELKFDQRLSEDRIHLAKVVESDGHL